MFCVRPAGIGIHAGWNPAGTEKRISIYMGIHQGRSARPGSQAGAGSPSLPFAVSWRPMEKIPQSPSSTEAQVQETSHQFKSASSQGEGNG
jgi:hypothetical protein